jgi:ATP-dependent protease HslVU (ClpYQ) peptidase subunit
MHEAADNSKQRQASQWRAMKNNAAARFEKIQADMEKKQRNIDAKTADVAAEWAEQDAMDALEYAAWVVDQANLAVLDAVDARARANAM